VVATDTTANLVACSPFLRRFPPSPLRFLFSHLSIDKVLAAGPVVTVQLAVLFRDG
jgi:hypothetical protein